MNRSFFLVWQPETGYTRYRHDDYQLAQLEAERLAAQNPGKEFLVLQAVGGAVSTNIQRIEFDVSDIPF